MPIYCINGALMILNRPPLYICSKKGFSDSFLLYWYFILVDSLPMHRGSDFDGVRALPSLSRNGAYLQCKKRFYELSCNSTTCNWSYMDQELTTAVKYPVMMYLP